jgi:hypothetical protein
LPFRHWFAIVRVEGHEQRLGPFATRRTATRKGRESARPDAVIEVVYEHTPPKPGRPER